MRAVNHQQLGKMAEKSYYTRVPLFVWGATGIGKSEQIKATAKKIAKDMGLPFSDGFADSKTFGFIDMRLSQYDPSDLRGLPHVVEGTGEKKELLTTWAFPDTLPRLGKGILILDEVNLAPPLVQSSAYQLVLDRKLGNYEVPEGWAIIAAGNRLEDKAHIFEMARPLCNRFTHIELAIPAIDDWVQWATFNGVDSRITTYLLWKPSFLYKLPETKVNEQAFPTPRSWGKYCSALMKSIDTEDYDEALLAAACCVGDGVAQEFVAYLKLSKKIDILKLLEHPEKIKEIEGIDMKYTILSALVEIAKKKPKENLEKVIATTDYLEPEFSILLFRFLKYGIKDFVKLVQGNTKIAQALRQYGKYLIED
jgi:hypothetical protein